MRRITLASVILLSISLAAVAEDELIEQFAKRYADQQQRYEEALDAAKTVDERLAAFEQLDPRNALANDYLEIEKQHRGEPVAVAALFHLTRNASSVGDPNLPSSQGRVQAVSILREHYLASPDLDLVLSYFDHGDLVPEAESLLRAALDSPHPRVRASARHALPRFLQQKAQFVEIFGNASKVADLLKTALPSRREMVMRMHEQAVKLHVDAAAERAEVLQLIEQAIAEDADLVALIPRAEDAGTLRVERVDPTMFGLPPTTYAELAAARKFELQHLQVGQVVPDISGQDAEGAEVKLSDYRGRVVLLLFSANWCGPCKAMYPELRKLQDELQSEPFAILAVMGDEEPKTVAEDTRSGEIRWRTLYDGMRGPIAVRWNIRNWPTVFLIDHNGVIIDRSPGRDSDVLRKAIDPLLAAQHAEPQAQEQVDEHPLPELPSVEEE